MAKRPKSAGITNMVILQYLQGMRTDLETRIGGVEKRIGSVETRIGGVETRIVSLERKMTEGFADVHVHLKHIDVALQRLYTRRVEMLGRIGRLEETVGIAA